MTRAGFAISAVGAFWIVFEIAYVWATTGGW